MQRDPTEPMEVWLTRLLHEVLDEQVSDRPAVSIDSEMEETDSPPEAEAAEITDIESLWEEPPDVRLNDVLPNLAADEPWQELDLQDQMQWVLRQLSALPPCSAVRSRFICWMAGIRMRSR